MKRSGNAAKMMRLKLFKHTGAVWHDSSEKSFLFCAIWANAKIYLTQIKSLKQSVLCQFRIQTCLWKRSNFYQRSGAIYKWISFMLDCFVKAFVLTQIEYTSVILSIFLTSSLEDNVFHFVKQRTPKISMFSGATSVTD